MEQEENISVTEVSYTTPPVRPKQHAPILPPPPTPSKQNSDGGTLGLVAMILSIVGAVFGVVPLTFLLAWILLPTGLILGIVSLFLNKKKGFGITAIVVSVVGAIISLLFVLIGLGLAMPEGLFDEDTDIDFGFGGNETIIEEEDSNDPLGLDDPLSDSEEVVIDGDALGTREDPIPLRTPFATEDWEVVVDNVYLDATAGVLAEKPYSEKPEEGNSYAVAVVTATYLGEGKGFTMDIGFAFVSDKGNTYKTFGANASAPEPRFGFVELYKGGQYTGNVLFEIPSDATGLIRVQPGIMAKEVFVQITPSDAETSDTLDDVDTA